MEAAAHCWMLPSTSFHSYEREGAEPPPRGWQARGVAETCSHLPLPTVGADRGHNVHAQRKSDDASNVNVAFGNASRKIRAMPVYNETPRNLNAK